MRRKNKNAFTLVELLAVIVILAIILVIAVPKIMSVIEDAKKATLESSAKMVASEAEKRKVQNQVLGKEENITCENVANINDIDYKNCYIEFLNNQAYVTIIGSNKFEDMYICKGTKNEAKVVDRCPNERVSVTIDPAGGSVKDLSGIYKEGDIIELENPEKEHATFINWNVVKGNSTLEDNKLTVGSEDTIVWAEYEEWGELIIDLDGGSVSNNQNGKYQSGTIIELETPTKENYKFAGWTIEVGTDAILSGTNLTIGTENVILTAIWEPLGTIYIMDLLENESILNNGLIVDDTVDQNIRYVGASPNNKVYFNCDDTDANSIAYGGANYDYASSCEVWRIIGVFDTKTSKAGTTKKRIKLINTESTFAASWDSSVEDVNFGHGINQWGPSGEYEGADLMRLLNGYYISSPESTCTYCNIQFQSTCEQTCTSESLNSANMKVLTNTAKVMVENVLWNIGAIEWNEELSPLQAYNAERGNTTGKICVSSGGNFDYCNDSVTRTTEWEGKIGLIYPSDYVYASTYEGCANDNSTCNVDNWLHPNADEIWTISPAAGERAIFVYRISNTDMLGLGVVGADIERFNMKVLPSLYLNENIRIVGGNGNTEPYKLSVQ